VGVGGAAVQQAERWTSGIAPLEPMQP
jgi:hypothetical protein